MVPTRSPSALRIEHREPELLVILQSSIFRVPRFQRSYVWDTEQVSDFSQDLWEGFDERKTWFVGTLIVSKGEKIERLGPALDIIDGQQRLTTLFLWLAALRAACLVRQIDSLALFIETTYLHDTSAMAPEGGQTRVSIGDGETNSHLQALVLNGESDRAPLRGSEERLQAAWDFFRQSIDVRLDTSPKPEELVKDLLEWLKESLHAFVAVTPTVATASKLFDLMNSRGRPLEGSDLLKSYLFYVTGGAAISQWAVIAQLFDPVASDARTTPSIDTFIRHQWFSRNGLPSSQQRGAPSQRATQDLIRRDATSKHASMRYLGQLRVDAEMYIQIARPSQKFWEAKSGKGVFEALQDLNILKIEVFRPLILSVIHVFPATDKLCCLRSLVSWAYRKGVVTSKLGSGEDEQAYFTAASQVANGTVASTQALLTLLDVPDDTRFMQSFATTNLFGRQGRWVLGRLEDKAEGSGERSTSWDTATLEHILPFSPKRLADWPGFTEEEHRSLRSNIGNLTLLLEAPNGGAANLSFAQKRQFYASSVLQITKSISTQNYPSWDKAAVRKRAEWLAGIAVRAFPLISP